MSSLRVRVLAEPKAGYSSPADRVKVYDAPTKRTILQVRLEPPPVVLIETGMTRGWPMTDWKAEASVDFTPWLDSGVDTNPATPGFQGNFAALFAHGSGIDHCRQ